MKKEISKTTIDENYLDDTLFDLDDDDIDPRRLRLSSHT